MDQDGGAGAERAAAVFRDPDSGVPPPASPSSGGGGGGGGGGGVVLHDVGHRRS